MARDDCRRAARGASDGRGAGLLDLRKIVILSEMIFGAKSRALVTARRDVGAYDADAASASACAAGCGRTMRFATAHAAAGRASDLHLEPRRQPKLGGIAVLLACVNPAQAQPQADGAAARIAAHPALAPSHLRRPLRFAVRIYAAASGHHLHQRRRHSEPQIC